MIVEIDGIPHQPEEVFPNQINVKLRPVVEFGDHSVVIQHLGRSSDPHQFRVVGTPPIIHGFEAIVLSREMEGNDDD